MSRKRYTPDQIIGKLREAEVALAQGETTGQVCRTLGIAEQTFYRWRREDGGLKVEQARRLNALATEQARRAAAARRPARTPGAVAQVVGSATGYKRGRTHPATRTFQALRIAVNGELEA